MIVMEGSLWPLVFVGAAADLANTDDVQLIDEERLASSEQLLLAVVVAGSGERSVTAQRAVLDWLEAHRRMLARRVCRLAWVVEDEDVRSCTEGWLRLTGSRLFAVPTGTFRTIRAAVSWLVDATPAGASGSRAS